jgi:hypothetical protein
MQSVITTDVADVLADNDSSSMPRDDEGFVRPTATNRSYTRSCVFHRRVRSVTRSSELTQPGVTRHGGWRPERAHCARVCRRPPRHGGVRGLMLGPNMFVAVSSLQARQLWPVR